MLQLVDEMQYMENQVEELKNRINNASQHSAAGSAGLSSVDKILKILNSHHSVYTHVDAEVSRLVMRMLEVSFVSGCCFSRACLLMPPWRLLLPSFVNCLSSPHDVVARGITG